MIAVDRLPAEIRESTRAVVWRYDYVDGRWAKVPYCPHRPDQRASVTAPATWGTFADALAVVAAGHAAGPGIVLGDGLVGVDLDHCRAPDTVERAALKIVRDLDSYTEVSPSGTGLHVLARGVLPSGRRRKGWIEMYTEARYFTVTGRRLEGTPKTINARTAALAALHARIFAPSGRSQRRTFPPAGRQTVALDDAVLLARARRAPNGAKFAALWAGDASAYESPSQADLALCNLLAFWTGGDALRVDHLFRASGLMRPKWDAQRGEETYGERTIATAIAGCAAYTRRTA